MLLLHCIIQGSNMGLKSVLAVFSSGVEKHFTNWRVWWNGWVQDHTHTKVLQHPFPNNLQKSKTFATTSVPQKLLELRCNMTLLDFLTFQEMKCEGILHKIWRKKWNICMWVRCSYGNIIGHGKIEKNYNVPSKLGGLIVYLSNRWSHVSVM